MVFNSPNHSSNSYTVDILQLNLCVIYCGPSMSVPEVSPQCQPTTDHIALSIYYWKIFVYKWTQFKPEFFKDYL